MTTKEIEKIKELKDEEILEEAYEAIVEKLGLAGFTRFIRLTQGGRGNWTEERREVLKKFNQLSIDELTEIIHKNTKGPQENQKLVK
jgi:hypothetical protein